MFLVKHPSANIVDYDCGTGFFVTEDYAVTAKHIFPEALKGHFFINCKFLISGHDPVHFDLAVHHISPDRDFVVLRRPTEFEFEANVSLKRMLLAPRPFPIGSSKLGQCYVPAFHHTTDIASTGLHLEAAAVTRLADDGAYFTAEMYPGDSGTAVVLNNGCAIGVFLGVRTGTHTHSIETPDSPSERVLKSGDQQVLEELDNLSVASVANSVNKSKHNFMLSMSHITPYLSTSSLAQRLK